MTNLTKCLKASGSCWSKKEEFAEYSRAGHVLEKEMITCNALCPGIYCACACSSFIADIDAHL